MLNVLIFGVTGQVGWALTNVPEAQEFNLITLSRDQADFCKPTEIYSAVINCRPDVVVNAVAYTAVDKAENDLEIADYVNARSVAVLARACSELDVPLIHISTDYVFDGKADRPYKESDSVSPLGVYGQTKLKGEAEVGMAAEKYIILRSSWIFGIHGNNFVKTMLKLAKERDEIRVVSDQYGCPTYAGHIAETIWEIIRKYQNEGSLPWGIYHLADSPGCSWFEFACCIVEQAKELSFMQKIPSVQPISTEQYPTPAKRPAKSVLDCRKLESLLGRQMFDWNSGLKHTLHHLNS